MKYLFVFLWVSLSSIVISQNRYHVDKTTFALNDTVVYLKHDMKPINGVLYCDNGDIGIYVNGKIDGLCREWYTNGQLMYEHNYKDGKEDGLGRMWYDNGQLLYEYNYKDGRDDGLHRLWHKDGQLCSESNYKDGEYDGLYRQWYENGQLNRKSNFKDGKRDGWSKKWYDNGQLKYEVNFKDGKLVNEKCYDENGNKIICEYKQ